jgi:hypothetical protein
MFQTKHVHSLISPPHGTLRLGAPVGVVEALALRWSSIFSTSASCGEPHSRAFL